MNVLTKKIKHSFPHFFSFLPSVFLSSPIRRTSLHLIVQFLLYGMLTSMYGWFYSLFRAVTSDAGMMYFIFIGVLFLGIIITEKLTTESLKSKITGSLVIVCWGLLSGYLLLASSMMTFFEIHRLVLEQADFTYLWENILTFMFPALILAELLWRLGSRSQKFTLFIFVGIFMLIGIRDYVISPSFFQVDLFTVQQEKGEIAAKQIDEPSGLAMSRHYPNVIWTHNDGKSGRAFFAIDTQSNHLATFHFPNLSPRDIEDMAISHDRQSDTDYIYLADIGDNHTFYHQIKIYRLPEPELDPENGYSEGNISQIEIMHLRYPDGKRDAEALIVDPIDQQIYIITKREAYSRLYKVGVFQENDSPKKLTFLQKLPFRSIVAADISPDGTEILMKTYHEVYYWKREKGESISETLAKHPVKLPYIPEPQGEAISWAADGRGYYTLSELNQGIIPRLYFYARNE